MLVNPYPWRLGQGKNFLSQKESFQSGPYLLNFEKICNPSLLSKNYFVLSNLLSKMSSYVSFFITSLKKWNLEGYYAFHKKPPRRSKIRKKNLLWILWAASSSYELPAISPLPHMLQLMPRFLLLPQQKLFVLCNFSLC